MKTSSADPQSSLVSQLVTWGGRVRSLLLFYADPAHPHPIVLLTQILAHIGFLMEESGDIFSPRVLKGRSLGEMVQWVDILAALYILGHSLWVTVSLKELQSNLVVPLGRVNCPLSMPLPFDLIYTDYHGLRRQSSTWDSPARSKGKEKFLGILNKYMEIHSTVYYESQRFPEVPTFVKNHGLLLQPLFQQLLCKAKFFTGFGFPNEGPAPLEAIAPGNVFLQSCFSPPCSSLNHEFFPGKPRKPHMWNVDYNSEESEAAIKAIMETQVEPYLPYEYTCGGSWSRDFCAAPSPALPGTGASHSPFILVLKATHLEWAQKPSMVPGAWPPPHSLCSWLTATRRACRDACLHHGLVCEPSF
ncbi:Alpha-1,6-mannosylglycoprotein 6-beta-N-acetylglucosaminyltransferase B [Sciurus carolinensis]|uniref:alpha-1,6-mannosyl-glycoprotein 6-beta-N-acetylglucosaminyltransferase n=1 Tax=Sciurus carolinensis TaxID=30640 RepID=A0AA41N0G9_SCICA|nr:Alpha-1,6-mannosylglycoprotein 6-beta-N-acetylglucosaminyltransferase B [Sciurus carolinensis]